MFQARLLLVLGLTAFLVLTACQRQQEEAGEMTEEFGDLLLDEERTASLDEVNNSGISGEVRVREVGDQTEIDLTIDGVLEGHTYVAHLHRGECGNDLGVVADIGEFTATAGENQISTTIDSATLEADRSHFVQAHQADQAPIACANLPRSTEML